MGLKVRGRRGCTECTNKRRPKRTVQLRAAKFTTPLKLPLSLPDLFLLTDPPHLYEACDRFLKIHRKSSLYITSCFNMWIRLSRGIRSIGVSAIPDRSMMYPDATKLWPQFRLRYQRFIIHSFIDEFEGSASSPSIPLGGQGLWKRGKMLTLRISVLGSCFHFFYSHCRSSFYVKIQIHSRIKVKALVRFKRILRIQNESGPKVLQETYIL